MNTKSSEISSGLVADFYVGETPLIRLPEVEAVIAQKDAEIIEQCRLLGIGSEREADLLGKVERQSAALKLAREVLMSVKETSSSTRLRRIVNEPLAAIDALGE